MLSRHTRLQPVMFGRSHQVSDLPLSTARRVGRRDRRYYIARIFCFCAENSWSFNMPRSLSAASFSS